VPGFVHCTHSLIREPTAAFGHPGQGPAQKSVYVLVYSFPSSSSKYLPLQKFFGHFQIQSFLWSGSSFRFTPPRAIGGRLDFNYNVYFVLKPITSTIRLFRSFLFIYHYPCLMNRALPSKWKPALPWKKLKRAGAIHDSLASI
jgi:hypothetical protein